MQVKTRCLPRTWSSCTVRWSRTERSRLGTSASSRRLPERLLQRQHGNKRGWPDGLLGNVEAAVWLHDHEKRKLEERQVEQQTSAQFQWAASETLRRFRTRLEKSLYDGPTARQDDEEAERQRWLHILAEKVRHSPTSMGGAAEQRKSLLEEAKVRPRCGHVSEPSGSSLTGSTPPTASSTHSQYSITQSTCGCACQSRATEEHRRQRITHK